ncbi:hypothetical protein AVEN_19436-1 [Araneus ventricosus]|uniref:Uncharacterized protein n=1 Tax=Araneus ventricosus TaxID=182803 RepID=A0A4Y2C700_ARAVE|nr:hypothetical protein AVEN_19436-1 [Araneus ventricosus]
MKLGFVMSLQNQNNSRWSGGTHGPPQNTVVSTQNHVFWDRQGILLVEFLPRGETINAVLYCETLRKLWCAIQTKGEECSVKALCCFMTTHVPILLVSLKTLFNNSVGSSSITSSTGPDLAPSDYQLFLNLKRDFEGRRFDS